MSADTDDDPARDQVRRQWLMDVNDGLIASAGMVEGVARAGAEPAVILVTGLATLLVGVVTVGGIRFTEASDERDARDAVIEAERRRIDLDPAAELAELTAIYEDKGLESALARRVAEDLSARDALAAQLDAEYRLDALSTEHGPWRAGARAGGAFALGALLPLLVGTVTPQSARIMLTVAAVLVALTVSAALAARSGRLPVGRAVLRTVSIGVVTMLITIALGSLLDLSSVEVDLDLDL